MKEELRLFLVFLWLLKEGQCKTMDTTTDLLSLGWKGPRADWIDYFNSTKDIRSKAGRYPDLPYDLLDRIPTGFGIWGLLHNDIGHGWTQDPNSFQIPTYSPTSPIENIHLRYFLHGNAFIEVVADNKVDKMITVDNPCGNSCRPKFRERIITFTNEGPNNQIIVRMNTTNLSDVVLIDSIILDFEGDVEDEDYSDDECECKLTTESDTTDPGESSASGDECLSTLDSLSDDSWTSPAKFYFQNISEVIAADVVAESNLADIADKQGIWAFAGNENLNSIRAEFSHNSSQTYYESVSITAILGGNGSIVVLDPTTSDLYTITDEFEGDDGWWTFIIDFDPMSTVQIIFNVTEKQDFVLLDKIIAYGNGCEVTGTSEVTPPMCECTTLSSTSAISTKTTTTSSATTKQAETTTTEISVPEESSPSTSSQASKPTTTSKKPPAETTTPDGASLVQPLIMMVLIPLIAQLA